MKQRIGIFFSHPTQHHSLLFNCLADSQNLTASIYYFHPGATQPLRDDGYGKTIRWDLELLHSKARILRNFTVTAKVVSAAQVCPEVPLICLKERFDWVWLGSYSSPASFLALLFSKLIGAKVMFQSDTNNVTERLKDRGLLHRIYTSIFYSMVDCFLAIGDHNKEHFIQRGCRAKLITFCPYPVDVGRFAQRAHASRLDGTADRLRKKLGISDSAAVLIYCGKLIDRKRPMDFIDAFTRLQETLEIPIYGILVGSGPLETTLREKTSNLQNLHITGFVNQLEIPTYFALGSLGVVCSDDDPHPLVCTEMAACGLPLVVSDKCGVWGPNDIVNPGESGLVYPSGDILALVTCVIQLIKNKNRQKQMAEMAMLRSKAQDYRIAAGKITKMVEEYAAN